MHHLDISPSPLPRFIAGIVPDGDEEAQCIRIAHPSGMYVTDDLIPVHNTDLGNDPPKPAPAHPNAETAAGIRESVEDMLGRQAAQRLIDDGTLVIHESPDSLPEGLASTVSRFGQKVSGIYEAKAKKIHLIAAYIRQGEAGAKIGHEGWYMFLDALKYQDGPAYILFSIADDSGHNYTPAQRQMFQRIGRDTPPKTIPERLRGFDWRALRGRLKP
jgi:hypothetical protein